MSVLECGRHTYGERIVVSRSAGAGNSIVRIGSFCSVATGVRCILGGEHRVDWAATFPFHGDWGSDKEPAFGRGDIVVGNDVWVGTDCLLLSGARVGDGAVLGARTVVSGEVAPYSIVAGSPMRFVRWRFPENIRTELLRIKWWDWPDSRIKNAVSAMQDADVEAFVRMVNRGNL